MSRRKKTSYIIVHSTKTRPNVELCARDIDEEHRKNGLLKIGYHVVIKRDGTIELGRSFNEIGAHFQEFDDKSVGVLLVGGLNSRGADAPDYTTEQQQSLFLILKTLTSIYKGGKVIGHACVNFNIEKWWADSSKFNLNIKGIYGD